MVKTKQLFLFISIYTLFLLAFPFSANAAPKYPEGTAVGEIIVEGATEEETLTNLMTEVAIWQNGEDLVLRSDIETFHLPRTAFQFDINGTLNDLNEQTKRSWKTFFMRPKDVQVSFIVNI